ncbi:Rv3235 family protein [Mycolicibacter engbaekii]|uniref:Rv3235 family protein n=1 Tax=Mycolicibacter engbaekii TaxID=188915 RepID=UPI001F445D09|nr:Rv3235 family protein [Mycolicibacter engbaekii]
MPADPCLPQRPTVAPLGDYEPPARPAPPARPGRSAVPSACVRVRHGHPGRTRPARPARTVLPPQLRSAAMFADAALRRVLEVLDGRRPAAHLFGLLAAGLADAVLAVRLAAPAGRVEPATLVRVRVQPAGSGEVARAVEVFGTYRRGRRTHALACRVESVPGSRTDTAWQVVALHIG